MEFEIGQIFEGEYPPEAAFWCNDCGDRYIKEIEPQNGVLRFQIVAIPDSTAEEIEARALAQAKAERAEAVSKIIVEVDGMNFDGDEHAQARMANAIKASEILGRSSVIWVLANDEVATVTVEQLKEAFAKSVVTMCEFWPRPYERA